MDFNTLAFWNDCSGKRHVENSGINQHNAKNGINKQYTIYFWLEIRCFILYQLYIFSSTNYYNNNSTQFWFYRKVFQMFFFNMNYFESLSVYHITSLANIWQGTNNFNSMEELMEHCHFVNGYRPIDPWPNCQCFYSYRVYVYNFVLKYFVKTVYFRKLSMIIIQPFENFKKKNLLSVLCLILCLKNQS